MRKTFALMRQHMHDNATTVTRHLRDNSGDGYIWFLIMTIAFLLIFGALFMIMHTAVDMRNIRDSVDEAAMDVFAEVRETAYQQITDGATNFSFTNLTNAKVTEMMANHLGATFNGGGLAPRIEQLDARNQLAYRIENLKFTYIPEINSIDNTASSNKKGDVDGNNTVDETDVTQIEEYIANKDSNKDGVVDGSDLPAGEALEQKYNITGDGVVDITDVLLVKGLVDYFAGHPSSSLEADYEKQSALLIITFQVTVDISYGSVHVGESVDNYYYYSTLSFKPA